MTTTSTSELLQIPKLFVSQKQSEEDILQRQLVNQANFQMTPIINSNLFQNQVPPYHLLMSHIKQEIIPQLPPLYEQQQSIFFSNNKVQYKFQWECVAVVLERFHQEQQGTYIRFYSKSSIEVKYNVLLLLDFYQHPIFYTHAALFLSQMKCAVYIPYLADMLKQYQSCLEVDVRFQVKVGLISFIEQYFQSKQFIVVCQGLSSMFAFDVLTEPRIRNQVSKIICLNNLANMKFIQQSVEPAQQSISPFQDSSKISGLDTGSFTGVTAQEITHVDSILSPFVECIEINEGIKPRAYSIDIIRRNQQILMSQQQQNANVQRHHSMICSTDSETQATLKTSNSQKNFQIDLLQIRDNERKRLLMLQTILSIDQYFDDVYNQNMDIRIHEFLLLERLSSKQRLIDAQQFLTQPTQQKYKESYLQTLTLLPIEQLVAFRLYEKYDIIDNHLFNFIFRVQKLAYQDCTAVIGQQCKVVQLFSTHSIFLNEKIMRNIETEITNVKNYTIQAMGHDIISCGMELVYKIIDQI